MESFDQQSIQPEAVIETEEVRKRSLASRAYLGSMAAFTGFANDVETIWNVGAEEIKEASWPKKLVVAPIVGASAIAMAFDLPFHETYLAKVGTHTFIETHGSTLYTGIANGLASLGIEGLIATGIGVGVNAMPKVTNEISSRLLRNNSEQRKFGGILDKSTYILSYGAGAYTFTRHYEREKKKIGPDIGTALKTAAFLGLANEGIGSGAAWLLDYGERHPEVANLCVDTVNVLKSTLFWLGFVSLRIGVKKLISHRRRAKQDVNDQPIDAQEIAFNSEEL